MVKWFPRRMFVSLGLLFLLLISFSPVTASSRPVATQSPALAQMLGPLDAGRANPFDLDRVQVGDPAPDFVLLDYQKRAVQLSRFRDRKIVILVFYRGHW